MVRRKRPLADRFWEKVDIQGSNECWLWMARIGTHGYGEINVDAQATTAHRIAYQLEIGDIPLGLNVCHTCDVRACVNPNHLFLGTDQDNADDKMKKGRHHYGHVPGSKNGRAKLKEDDIIEIRKLLNAGVYQHIIGKKYGVSQVKISQIKLNKCWRHVNE